MTEKQAKILALENAHCREEPSAGSRISLPQSPAHILLRTADCTLKLSPLIAGRFLICPELGKTNCRCTCCNQNPLCAGFLHAVTEMAFIPFRSAPKPPVFLQNQCQHFKFFFIFFYYYFEGRAGAGGREGGCYFYRSRTGS